MKVSIGWFFYDFKKGFTRQECFVSLCETFDNEASSENTVNNWFAEFCHGCVYVSDESPEGVSKLVVIPNRDEVLKMIERDWHVMYHEIEASLSIYIPAI